MTKHIQNFFFCTILIFFNSKTINAQRYIGINLGYNVGKYFESWKEKYSEFDSKYRINDGYQVSLYYQQVNPNNKGRFELQYGSQKTELDVRKIEGSNSSYKNIEYTFQYIQMNFDYSFSLINKNNKSMDIFVGPSGSLNFNSLATGNGWDYVPVIVFLPNGQQYYTMTKEKWEISNEKGRGLSKFNLGVNFGFDFCFVISKNFDCIIQNRNVLFVNKQIFLSDINPTAFIKSGLSVGLRYRFS
jgi:hypothetical protein